MTIAAFTQKRQNQTRRLATTSSSRSCWLSRPKRLGRGISRWKTGSMTPPKQTMSPERRDDRPEPRPALGLVQPDDDGGRGEQATAVAARVRRRHWLASSFESSTCWKPPTGCASLATVEV
jgi:hypothetical protein